MFRVQILSFLFLLAFAIKINAQSTQYVIKGTVSDAETGETLPFASVFLANTTIGTVSNKDGDFELIIPKKGSYDFIVKFAAYETYVRSVQFFEFKTIDIDVQLTPETRQLSGVVVTAKKDDEWRRNLEDFKKGFLGTSIFAQRCKIVNEEAIDFYFDKENNVFEAFANEPLIIENKSLGYRLKYVLEGYKVYYNERYTSYWGFPSFEELREKGPRNRWLDNREIAYNGSVDHFFSSLFSGKLDDEGFYVQMGRDVDGKRFLDRNKIDLNQFVKPGQTSNSKRLEFENILYVTYTREAPDILSPSRDFRSPSSFSGGNRQRSVLFLREGKTYIEFESNGYIYNPLDFLVGEYWGYEKVGELMPIDYIHTREKE